MADTDAVNQPPDKRLPPINEATPEGHCAMAAACAHRCLDDAGVPRKDRHGTLSLWGRIVRFRHMTLTPKKGRRIMSKPITPGEITPAKAASLPDNVIDVFNELIAAAWNGHHAIVKQKDAAREIASRMEVPVDHVYQRGWLDVEDIYRKAGWKVEYDKPAYCETYDATFTFKKKKNAGS